MPDVCDQTGRDSTAAPLTDAELSAYGEQAFTGLKSVVLAVSGGADSMALMALAAFWASRYPSDSAFHVATVDHGLRTGSAEEARWVCRQALRCGLNHKTLMWNGQKPSTGHQAAAREARYALLDEHVEHLALPSPAAIAVAHHLEDQAETLLMRLSRGSGLDGLSGMLPTRRLDNWNNRPDVSIIRPFLNVPKARLRATLVARGLDWLEDPSNSNPDFERVRLRRSMQVARALGLSSIAVATSARRLGRARLALEHVTGELAARAVETNAGAYARIDLDAFDAAPTELRLRLLQRIIRGFGGATGPPRMNRLEDLTQQLSEKPITTATLGGCQLRRTPQTILAFREPGRRGLPELTLQPGRRAVWDGRFRVAAPSGSLGQFSAPIVVKALPATALAQLAPISNSMLPRAAALTLPSFWQADRLLAVPHLQIIVAPSPPFDTGFTAEFIGL